MINDCLPAYLQKDIKIRQWVMLSKRVYFHLNGNFLMGAPVKFAYMPIVRIFKIRHSTENLATFWGTNSDCQAVWPDWAIYWTLGKFLKPLATINLPKSPTFLGIFCKVVKIFHFPVKSFLGNFYRHWAIFFLVTMLPRDLLRRRCGIGLVQW